MNSLFNENAVLYNSGNGLNGAAYENDTVRSPDYSELSYELLISV